MENDNEDLSPPTDITSEDITGDEFSPGVESASEYSGPGPSPAETDALAWEAVDEASQRKRCAGARGLNTYIRDVAHAYTTPKNDDRTNIIDQGARTTYSFGNEQLSHLFHHLEVCRLEKSITHFSERQGTPAVPRSGLMIDFDIIVATRKPVLTDRHFYRLTGALMASLQRDIDFSSQLPPLVGGKKPIETTVHVFFTVKTAATPLLQTPAGLILAGQTAEAGDEAAQPTSTPVYKYGFHILVPGIKLDRSYKKWLIRQLKDDPAVIATLQELDVVGNPAACLDQGSASAPPLFFGSCKRGGIPYVLGAALEVTLDIGCDGAGYTPQPVIKPLDQKIGLAGYNLVAEMGLVVEAEYDDGRDPLVRKFEFDCRPEVAEKAQDWQIRSQGDCTPTENLIIAEHSLSTLTMHNAEALYLHALLDLLGDEFYNDRNRWRDVVFALANTSDQYKPLAVWFSHKGRHVTHQGSRVDDLDQVWDDALARRGGPGKPLTLRSIAYWAQTADAERYAEIKERSYFTMLTSYVYAHGGKLQHYMIAKVLHAMLGSKFCVDIDSGSRGQKAYCWFEFVLPGQSMKPGEVWKWRKEVDPDDVHIYMSEKLTQVLDQIGEHIDERRVGADNENQAKYYQMLGRAFAISKNNLYNHTFKRGVIDQANYLFRRRGFVDQLDRDPGLFGTENGVLRLGRRCELIDYFHEYPISRFTTVAWKRFDPTDPWTLLVLGAIADIIPEPDAREWILFHGAQGLSGAEKEGLFLLWMGGGQNGKTALLRWFAKALGPYADKFNIQLMCSDREDADKPNSAMMKFKHLNWAYAEELNRAQSINVARMKEMVNAGEVSGRDLNSKQESFTMRCNFVAASQYSFIIDTTDHGTWRRIKHYVAKTKFRKDPDPANPYEKKDDQRFVRIYPSSPQFLSSVLSILVHYYERLQNEYGGELKNVYSPTIERETAEFRLSQDSLHRWISERVIVSPSSDAEYALGVLSSYYTEWYTSNIERKRHVAADIIKEIESSAISGYLKPAPNRTLVLKGCRVLVPDDEMTLRPGEELLCDAEMRGRRSVGEWAEGCAAAGDPSSHAMINRGPWWEAKQPPAAPVVEPADDDSDLFSPLDDDRALMRSIQAERTASALPDRTDDCRLGDGDIDDLLSTGWVIPYAGPAAPRSFALADVYAWPHPSGVTATLSTRGHPAAAGEQLDCLAASARTRR